MMVILQRYMSVLPPFGFQPSIVKLRPGQEADTLSLLSKPG